MSWNYNRSLERINEHLDSLGKITIEKLRREANLDQLLSETNCREIFGAHVYVQLAGLAPRASDRDLTDQDYRQLIQATHVYQREVSRIVEGKVFDGLRVHFQGAKLHALFYLPIDDDETIATQALLLQLVLRDFVHAVFTPAFPSLHLALASGTDMGDVIGTRNGTRGDRELLFLGPAANHAAKITSSGNRVRLTQHVYDALPTELQDLCTLVEDGVYQAQMPDADDLEALLAEQGITWDRDKSATRIEEDIDRFPLAKIEYESATTLIDLDSLSVYNNKRVVAASIFADVAGFTRYIDGAATMLEQESALRVFHAIRKELARVVRSDFGALRIQFQGDRIQALIHLPKDDEGAIGTLATELAVSLQSSMEITLKECLPEADSLRLAIGIDLGTTLVSKLGSRAHRDRICLGAAVEAAAACEERCEGGWIGITRAVYEGLPDELSTRFHHDASARCYVAKDLTITDVERARRAATYAAGGVHLRHTDKGAVVSVREDAANTGTYITPARPYAHEE